jgi:16S rRNA (guanine527-N7)-methyltransferase
VRKQFIDSVTIHQSAFGLDLDQHATERLADYYELVLEHNPLLHLVGPCSAEEFVIRHILESLTLLKHLPRGAKFADIGAGAGLPSIPCLLARDDLYAVLIESKAKKTAFLQTAVETLNISNRAEIVNRQFEEADPTDCKFITCRALDKFTEKLPRLLKWAKDRSLLLFGGNNLRDELEKFRVDFTEQLLPLSEQRYIFAVRK